MPTNLATLQSASHHTSRQFYATLADDILPTGFSTLDRLLPGGGWPLNSIIELLSPAGFVDPLTLLLPLFADRCKSDKHRWIGWVAPPHLPANEDLVDAGMALSRVMVAHPRGGSTPLEAVEKAVNSGNFSAVVVWLNQINHQHLARIKQAAFTHSTSVFLLRPHSVEKESPDTNVELRLYIGTHGHHLDVEVLRSRFHPGNIISAAEVGHPLLFTPHYYRRRTQPANFRFVAARPADLIDYPGTTTTTQSANSDRQRRLPSSNRTVEQIPRPRPRNQFRPSGCSLQVG